MNTFEMLAQIGFHFVKLCKIENEHGTVWRALGNANNLNYPDWGYSCAGGTPEEAIKELYETLISHNVIKPISDI